MLILATDISKLTEKMSAWHFGSDKIEVLEEIQPYIWSRQKVTVQVKNDKVFNDLRSLF